MRRLLILMILTLSMISCAHAVNIEPDKNIHSVIGGLYSLGAAVELNGNINPEISQLTKYFVSEPKNMQLTRVKNSIWAGVEVNKNSRVKNYLRSHSQELGIMESPAGKSEWFSGDYAWLKVADVVKGKLVPVKFFASEGDGEIFFTNKDKNLWWTANPKFTAQASHEILSKYGINQPDLHVPSESKRVSIYNSVRPSEVSKPEKIHVGSKKNSFDMGMDIGDIRFDPIPNRPRN